jgi:hypothetical protein
MIDRHYIIRDSINSLARCPIPVDRLQGSSLQTLAFVFRRRLALPRAIQSWSLTSLEQRLFKTGGRLIRHARYFILQLAESYLTPRLFGQILGRIERLAWHPT